MRIGYATLPPALGAALILAASAALGGEMPRYEVRITNITQGQTFTPILAVTHAHDVRILELGAAASPELEALAEAGDTAPLSDALRALGDAVGEITTSPGLLAPGETRTIPIQPGPRARRLSLAAMLIPTNDNFVALDGAVLPRRGQQTLHLLAYDAGTEENDQNCAHIPGPRCGGAGASAPADGDEGFVHVSRGFHELGAEDELGNEILGPFSYDWRNPVAVVTIRRIDE
ncbi:MAG: spondin domain-containing protein [Myxococcales bacterium]|nr:spondin domain-containing protein [Myxococcales bacterium]MDH5565592.1 spondin domain-containing protein [Myxococcales bacterium]